MAPETISQTHLPVCGQLASSGTVSYEIRICSLPWPGVCPLPCLRGGLGWGGRGGVVVEPRITNLPPPNLTALGVLAEAASPPRAAALRSCEAVHCSLLTPWPGGGAIS